MAGVGMREMNMRDVLNVIEWYWPDCVIPLSVVLAICAILYFIAHIRWFVPHAVKKLRTEHAAELRAVREQMTVVAMSKDHEIRKIQDQKSRIVDALDVLYREAEGMEGDLTWTRKIIAVFGMKIHEIQTMGIFYMKFMRIHDRIRGDEQMAKEWDELINRDRNSRRLLEGFLTRVLGESYLNTLVGYSEYSERRNKIADGDW